MYIRIKGTGLDDSYSGGFHLKQAGFENGEVYKVLVKTAVYDTIYNEDDDDEEGVVDYETPPDLFYVIEKRVGKKRHPYLGTTRFTEGHTTPATDEIIRYVVPESDEVYERNPYVYTLSEVFCEEIDPEDLSNEELAGLLKHDSLYLEMKGG